MAKQPLSHLICGALLTMSAAVATAQSTVYRCGPDGRTFSEKPCADGGGRAMSVDDSRTAAEQKAAHEVAHREARTASNLAQGNRQYERSLRPGGAVSLSESGKTEKTAKPASKADNKAHKPKTRKASVPEGFTAVVPGSEPKKRRRS